MQTNALCIVDDVVKSVVVISAAVLVSLTTWVVAVRISIAVAVDSVVVTKVQTISQTFNGNLISV